MRRPISLEQAQNVLRRRLEQRELDFLRLALKAIYQNPKSPYLGLLRLAGCEFGDLQRIVNQDGLEAALQVLYRQGVYLTVDELKDRRAAVRGGHTIPVQPSLLRNPSSAFQLLAQSGGSRGSRTPVPLDLAFIRDQAVNWRLSLEARGCSRGPHAQWNVPGALPLINILESAACGAPKVRWFSQVDPAAPGLHSRYRWSAQVLRWGGRLAGLGVPRPEYVPFDDPLPIAHWLAQAVSSGGMPELGTPPSGAARVCQAAIETGLDLRGAHFSVGGEPLTAARLAVVRQAGAEATTHYRSTESGRVGHGCLAREMPDELHLYDDLLALIQPGPDGQQAGLPPLALLVSSLRSTAPLILLNVSLGDQAELVRRACGCPLERLGWTTRLHTVRSFEKLSAAGMTFADTDLVRILEEVMPSRFGGSAVHYQLIEEETDRGRPLLRLLVHPAVGPLDPQTVADAFLKAIGDGAAGERVMELQWRQGGLLRVERRAPQTTASGKVLHLHQERTTTDSRTRPTS